MQQTTMSKEQPQEQVSDQILAEAIEGMAIAIEHIRRSRGVISPELTQMQRHQQEILGRFGIAGSGHAPVIPEAINGGLSVA